MIAIYETTMVLEAKEGGGRRRRRRKLRSLKGHNGGKAMIVDTVGQGYSGVLIWALGWTEACRQGAKEVLRHVVVRRVWGKVGGGLVHWWESLGRVGES